ncbi:MAG TPA: DUF4097 family beta strand repeat-containing protein [Gemmatimonadales bacterium]|nr:DUF4097 family beta strand repeat-containing protein [Gemmatimonadales bacterium]
MKAISHAFIGLGMIALTPLAANAQGFRWHGALAAGKTLEVRGINGPIHATRATGSEAVVTATKTARKSDTASVQIRVVTGDRGVTICAVYPSRHSGDTNECRSGGAGDNDTKDNDVSVAFEVQVPAGVEFDGSTVNGGVVGRDLPGNASLSTVNGDVDVEAGGVARGSTVNGSIKAKLGRADWEQPLKLSTVNGGIAVTLPATASCELQAETVNGSIESDFPVTMTGRINPRSLRGQIGSGGRELKLSTVNGSIQLIKAS